MSVSTVATGLLADVTAGVSFDIPAVDLSSPVFSLPGDETAEFYQAVTRIAIDAITDGDVNGTGAFDKFMAAGKAHLMVEYDKGRITGAEFTKAYIALMELAMSNATQFILAREETFWNAQKGQIDAIIGRAKLEQERLLTAQVQIEANNAKATYAKTVLSLANEGVTYDQGKFTLDTILPKNGLILDGQKSKIDAELLIIPKQGALVDEQLEAARAQTMDTRTDGVTVITGSIGKQKDLYSQQITSYQRDAETKAAKIFSDAWITQKTIDEGLTAPNMFTNASVDQVLGGLKTNLGL